MSFGSIHLETGAVIAVVFWLFVAAICIIPMIVVYKIRSSAMAAIRAAIDRGQDLSPDIIKQLSNMGETRAKKVSHVNVQIAGIIVLAFGFGAGAVATVFLYAVPIAAPFVYAGASLIVCLGAGLFFASKVMQQHEQNEKAANSIL